jgi:hypothetical protein
MEAAWALEKTGVKVYHLEVRLCYDWKRKREKKEKEKRKRNKKKLTLTSARVHTWLCCGALVFDSEAPFIISQVGQPNFESPPSAVLAAQKAVANPTYQRYIGNCGLDVARDAVAKM